MSPIFQTKTFRVCCFILIFICAALQVRYSLQEQRDLREKIAGTAIIKTKNPHLLTHYANQKHLFEADLPAAKSLLQQALISNAYHIPAWLGLAAIYNDFGDKQRALAILEYVDILTQQLKRWRWKKLLVAYELGETELLPSELRYIIREIPGKIRRDALQFAFVLWEEPDELLSLVGEENVSHLFKHAVRTKSPDTALFFWKRIEEEGIEWQDPELLGFLNLLRSRDQLTIAAVMWRKYFNPNSLEYNGDFSQPFLQQGFGWIERFDKGFERRFEKISHGDSGRQLHYRFKGWENINFYHLSQIVPLEPRKRYKLTAELKSQKITTDQRPFLELDGYKCKTLNLHSEMVDSEQDWKIYTIEFELPTECPAVILRLRRKPSNMIDSKLGGHLWLRNINLESLGEDFSNLSILSQ